MVQDIDQASRFAFLQGSLLIFLLLLVPIVLSNNPTDAALGVLVIVVVFFFPGYLLLSLLGKLSGGERTILSPVFGIASITTAYDIFARAPIATYFPYLVVILSAAGMILFALQARRAPTPSVWTLRGYETIVAGSAVAFSVAPVFWRSGRFSHGEFVFYGPVGQDHLYHLTLLQRLLHHVPPDNFVVSGLRAPVYHYFDDLTLALILRAQNTLHLRASDLFDVYYRCYPILVYFLLGALAYRAGRRLVGSPRGGILSVLLLLGAGGLGWFFGAVQTAAHAAHFYRDAGVALFQGRCRFLSAPGSSPCPLPRPSDLSRGDQCPSAARALPARLACSGVVVGADGRIQLHACCDIGRCCRTRLPPIVLAAQATRSA